MRAQKTTLTFESIQERDIDLLLMRQFACENKSFIKLFLHSAGIEGLEYKVTSVSHSVMTTDGESDIEVILAVGQKHVAILIEDKIDAIAQPEQAKRYQIRASKAKKQGLYDEFHIFIVAPQKYLAGNKEAGLYKNKLPYEEIRETLDSEFDKALLERALDEAKHGYIPIEDKAVTRFWNALYDYIDKQYPDTFSVQGKKGDSRGTNAVWISFNCGQGIVAVLKTDKEYVDLEIPQYADRFVEFSKKNQKLLDEKRLIVRVATHSLAVRKYIGKIDFSKDFYEQLEVIDDALIKVKQLQDLVKDLKL